MPCLHPSAVKYGVLLRDCRFSKTPPVSFADIPLQEGDETSLPLRGRWHAARRDGRSLPQKIPPVPFGSGRDNMPRKNSAAFVRLPHPPQVERYSLKRGLSGSVRRAGLVPSRSSQWPSFQVALPLQLRDSTGIAPVFPQSRRSSYSIVRAKNGQTRPLPCAYRFFPHYKRMILNLQYRYPYGYIHEKSSKKS